MPQEKRYASPAERQKAYRERKARELVDPDLPARDVAEIDEEPAVPEPLPLKISLEDYVALTVREAAFYADSIGETDAPYTMWAGTVIENRKRDRLARAEKYARWRYAGVQSGEVGSL